MIELSFPPAVILILGAFLIAVARPAIRPVIVLLAPLADAVGYLAAAGRRAPHHAVPRLPDRAGGGGQAAAPVRHGVRNHGVRRRPVRAPPGALDGAVGRLRLCRRRRRRELRRRPDHDVHVLGVHGHLLDGGRVVRRHGRGAAGRRALCAHAPRRGRGPQDRHRRGHGPHRVHRHPAAGPRHRWTPGSCSRACSSTRPRRR